MTKWDDASASRPCDMQSRRHHDVPAIRRPRLARALGAAIAIGALIAPVSAFAQNPPKRQPQGFMETLMQGPRLTTTPPEAADWVRASRPPEGTRSGARPPQQPQRPLLSADEIRKREAALDAARARHDRLAGRRSPQGPFGSAARDPEPKTGDTQPACVLTCPNPIGVPRRR